ncbi:DUF3592 domain-containing protein [Ruminococcus flavefaciens]|uniref:DUF3592 domain-containing protein n=1 Tax=Ruminococcus flavefaciens 007c TaxID=1341157 RepID=W7UKW5_RUMFL|nr:DUF3592 domain-containing protein [Ruminococcus flavefaciens]EWM54418.1 hypothetical protein RF007C_12475 [Ruminococcus flavefaciens 007c]
MFVYFIAILPLALGSYTFYSLFKSIKNCTVMVEAEIIDIMTGEDTDLDGYTTLYYKPVFRYYYDGHEYISSEMTEYPSINYQKGDTLTIYINPEFPDEVLNKKIRTKSYIAFGTLCILFSILIIAINLFFSYHSS